LRPLGSPCRFEEEPIRYCTTCGTELADDARYCGNCGAPVGAATQAASPTQPLPATEPAANAPPLSSALRRLGALALDLLLFIVTLGIGWLVWSLIVWARGQSPAKQLLGMRVVHADTLETVSWGRMALREIVCKEIVGLAAAITFVGIVLYFWLLWDDQNQELWDKMATTLVVDG
jgi:uncharacterized RDD family membrane protein YckC